MGWARFYLSPCDWLAGADFLSGMAWMDGYILYAIFLVQNKNKARKIPQRDSLRDFFVFRHCDAGSNPR
jgi:hypothetical protein